MIFQAKQRSKEIHSLSGIRTVVINIIINNYCKNDTDDNNIQCKAENNQCKMTLMTMIFQAKQRRSTRAQSSTRSRRSVVARIASISSPRTQMTSQVTYRVSYTHFIHWMQISVILSRITLYVKLNWKQISWDIYIFESQHDIFVFENCVNFPVLFYNILFLLRISYL